MNLVFASTVYISNAQSVMMRDEPDLTANVLVKLDKNTPVELLKSDTKKNYSYIRTNKNQTGWVRTKFLNKSIDQRNDGFFVREWNKVKDFYQKSRGDKKLIKEDSDNQNQQIEVLQKKVDELTQSQHNAFFWFITGAGTALIGIFIGFIFGAKRKRRSGWY